MEDATKKTNILNKANAEIKKAMKLSPESDELLVLEAFYYQAMIMVNPQMYGQSYSGQGCFLTDGGTKTTTLVIQGLLFFWHRMFTIPRWNMVAVKKKPSRCLPKLLHCMKNKILPIF